VAVKLIIPPDTVGVGMDTTRSLQHCTARQWSFNQLGFPVMSGQNTLGMWASYYYDTWLPIGGLQTFANLFVRFIHENGGEVHLGERIRRIRMENGQATGVELQDGDFIPANWVVSAADLNHTCFELIGRDHLSSTMIEKLEKAHPSESLFAVFWAYATARSFPLP
jgi:phytoene dehydrogenase-like protein